MKEVRRIRRALDLTQEELAKKAGLNVVTVIHVENGKTSPNVETLEKLAEALDVGIADFFPKAQASSERGFSETEIALAQAYLEQRRNAHRLLSALQGIANAIAYDWEESDRELSLDEIRASLLGLEAMLKADIFEIRRHRHNDLVDAVVDTRVQDYSDDRELEMLRKAVARLRDAAEPVFERERADKERRRFKVIEGAMAERNYEKTA